MRVAAVIVGAAGALIGLVKVLGEYLFALSVGIGVGGLLTNDYLHVVMGTNALLAVFCVVALIGAVYVGRDRLHAGSALLFAAAGGVVVATVVYVYLFATIMAPVREVDPTVSTSPNALSYVTWLAPAPVLLAAATLALLARRSRR